MKISKEETLRRSGMAYALSVIIDAEKQGKSAQEQIDALKEEIRFRGITGANLSIPRTEVERFQNEVKNNCCLTFRLLTMCVLHDKYSFGRKRLDEFAEYFMKYTESILKDNTNWEEYQEMLLDETGVECNLTDEFKKMRGGA